MFDRYHFSLRHLILDNTVLSYVHINIFEINQINLIGLANIVISYISKLIESVAN